MDATGGRMFADPDVTPTTLPTPVRRVYFNGFQALPQTSASPNVALLGASVQPAPATHHRAMLGVWKDCNRDGYVGLAESALVDYKSELADRAVCPPEVYRGVPVHNDGVWVREFLDIGKVDPCEFEPGSCGAEPFALNERVLYDNATFVWADVGAPGSVPEAECILAPLPRGATTGTGAMLGWADCQSRRGIVRAINALDPNGEQGVRFEDPARPQDSSSVLNQRFPVTPFGTPSQPGVLQDGTDARAFDAWDCSAPKGGLDVRDPTGQGSLAAQDPTGLLGAEDFPMVIPYTLTGVGFVDEDSDPSTGGVLRVGYADREGSVAWLASPAPAVHDPTRASTWAALARAADGVNNDCDARTPNAAEESYPGDAVENDASPILEARKDRPSFTFTFYDGHRGIRREVDEMTGTTTPSDGGTLALDHGRGGDGPMWSATTEAAQDPQLVERATLEPEGARYVTYYARVGAAIISARGLTLPNAALGVYGAENCPSIALGAPSSRGWTCDPALWWKDQQGVDNRPRFANGAPLGRLVGDVYNMRDVDCMDGRLARGVDAHASLAPYSTDGVCDTGGP